MQHVVGQNLSLGEKAKSSENQKAERVPKGQNGFRLKILLPLEYTDIHSTLLLFSLTF